ncbi:hypothetical protein NEDG_01478 [Nematocida displodere]|uniref:Uncharacterized protein n=1 Tax=Nematocida displodere TaxID=1805483 RepID=A0A177EEM9_9MICR|nr:hypothetical protein NEDG_01478 [Nematocida displodere]
MKKVLVTLLALSLVLAIPTTMETATNYLSSLRDRIKDSFSKISEKQELGKRYSNIKRDLGNFITKAATKTHKNIQHLKNEVIQPKLASLKKKIESEHQKYKDKKQGQANATKEQAGQPITEQASQPEQEENTDGDENRELNVEELKEMLRKYLEQNNTDEEDGITGVSEEAGRGDL